MGHRQYAVRQVLGRSHAICMVSLERGWANSKPLAASPWSNFGPSATCHSAGAGPIPRYWPCLFQGKLGQSHAIGIVSLEEDVEAQRGKSWSAAKHADQSVRTGVLRHTSYTAYTLMSVPDLQGSSVAKTIRRR